MHTACLVVNLCPPDDGSRSDGGELEDVGHEDHRVYHGAWLNPLVDNVEKVVVLRHVVGRLDADVGRVSEEKLALANVDVAHSVNGNLLLVHRRDVFVVHEGRVAHRREVVGRARDALGVARRLEASVGQGSQLGGIADDHLDDARKVAIVACDVRAQGLVRFHHDGVETGLLHLDV